MAALELNLSCPNVSGGVDFATDPQVTRRVVQRVRDVCPLPILAKLTPKGYEEISRAHLLEPTLFSRGRDVVWSHPAFANRCVYVRNDKEIICVSLAR